MDVNRSSSGERSERAGYACDCVRDIWAGLNV